MTKGVHLCRACGFRTAKWLGRCPECDRWGSLEAVSEVATETVAVEAVPWPRLPQADARRRSTGSAEFDRALGGGLVPGSVVLVGGEPGIGKSTLLLQAASDLASGGQRVLYVSGEESLPQLRLRGERLGVHSADLLVLAETDVDAACAAARRESVNALVVDSIQAVRCRDLDSISGSVAQVRESASRFVSLAKASGIPVFLVGHVTKDGALAGPRLLEHAVDTVLHFEGDRHHAHRILRARKNRFGASDEIGVFAMGDSGLRGVPHPSEAFLAERCREVPGSVVLAALEGTRTLLVEVQALVGEPSQATPRRTALGVDGGRLALILAVLERRAGLPLASRDVFVNVVGGIAVEEPAADLAIALAIASSLLGRPAPPRLVAAGEIGLVGEIRSVSRLGTRLQEGARMGFDTAVVAASASASEAPAGMGLRRSGHVLEALGALLDAPGSRAGQIG